MEIQDKLKELEERVEELEDNHTIREEFVNLAPSLVEKGEIYNKIRNRK